jgi:hypothetical protein
MSLIFPNPPSKSVFNTLADDFVASYIPNPAAGGGTLSIINGGSASISGSFFFPGYSASSEFQKTPRFEATSGTGTMSINFGNYLVFTGTNGLSVKIKGLFGIGTNNNNSGFTLGLLEQGASIPNPPRTDTTIKRLQIAANNNDTNYVFAVCNGSSVSTFPMFAREPFRLFDFEMEIAKSSFITTRIQYLDWNFNTVASFVNVSQSVFSPVNHAFILFASTFITGGNMTLAFGKLIFNQTR